MDEDDTPNIIGQQEGEDEELDELLQNAGARPSDYDEDEENGDD